jgi:hypothetical protein
MERKYSFYLVLKVWVKVSYINKGDVMRIACLPFVSFTGGLHSSDSFLLTPYNMIRLRQKDATDVFQHVVV